MAGIDELELDANRGQLNSGVRSLGPWRHPSLRELLLQFLIGIVIATVASLVGAQWMDVPYLFDPVINELSFVFSAGIGVLFGFFTARRAARMDPIEALRHE